MIKIDAKTFYERLSFVKDGTMNRGMGLMYQKVCMEMGPKGVWLRSFNQMSHTLALVSREAQKPVRMLFDPTPLLGAIRRVNGELTLDVGRRGLEISGPIEVQHTCLDGEDFIDFPEQEADPVLLEDEGGLSDALKQAESAVDDNAPNQRFAGIYIGDRHSPGSIRCVGCNTTSLVEVEMGEAGDAENFSGESIVPAQALKQIRTILDGDQAVNLYLGEREASFVSEVGAVCARLVAEKYPNYPAIMPDRKNTQEFKMPSDDFETGLRICQEYTEDFSSVFLDFDGDKLTVSATEGEGGSASYTVPVETVEMGRMRLKCSADRMLEVVKPMKGRSMSMFIPIEEEPTRVRIEGETPEVRGAVALMYLQPGEELEEFDQDEELQAAVA